MSPLAEHLAREGAPDPEGAAIDCVDFFTVLLSLPSTGERREANLEGDGQATKERDPRAA